MAESNKDQGFLVYSQRMALRRRMILWVIVLAIVVLFGAAVLLYARLTDPAGRGITAGVSAPKYVWVQMLEDNDGRRPGGRLARAIVTDGDRCPPVVVGGVHEVMEVRRFAARAEFPILLCEARLDAMSDAWIGNQHLPVRPANVTDMIVIGDTGCRITHYAWQACSDGEKWPFGSVASNAARLIGSNVQPVILHLGDFHYREKPCADANWRCTRTPFGDNWATWEEEFFRPARPLLAAAPWIMLRGNHEDCQRAGAGWQFLFDLQSYKDVCQEDREPYKLTIGGSADHPHVLVVFDTANEKNEHARKERLDTYARWVEQLRIPGADVWLALHQPLWHCGDEEDRQDTSDPAASRRAYCALGEPKGPLTKIREQLSAPGAASLVSVVLSGDIHMFQLFAPKQGEQPVQIVAGVGGTSLDALPKGDAAAAAAGADASESDFFIVEDTVLFGAGGTVWGVARHGFVKLHRDGARWTLELRDAGGRLLVSCRVRGRETTLPPAGAASDGCDEPSAGSWSRH